MDNSSINNSIIEINYSQVHLSIYVHTAISNSVSLKVKRIFEMNYLKCDLVLFNDSYPLLHKTDSIDFSKQKFLIICNIDIYIGLLEFMKTNLQICHIMCTDANNLIHEYTRLGGHSSSGSQSENCFILQQLLMLFTFPAIFVEDINESSSQNKSLIDYDSCISNSLAEDIYSGLKCKLLLSMSSVGLGSDNKISSIIWICGSDIHAQSIFTNSTHLLFSCLTGKATCPLQMGRIETSMASAKNCNNIFINLYDADGWPISMRGHLR